MKQKKRVKKGRSGKGRIAVLKASAKEAKRRQDLLAGVGKWYKPIKKPVTLRLDADVLAWFKKRGPGYQTRINRALRKLMLEKTRSG